MSLSRKLARPLLATGFLYGAVTALRNSEALAPKAATVTDKLVPAAKKAGVPLPDDTVTLVRLNAAVQISGALALATGRAPRIGALMLAGSLLPTTIAGHAFWAESDPAAKKAQLGLFMKNVSMLGGALIAAGDTDGEPGLAWRAKRAARDTGRSARRAAKTARREAKLARKSVG